MLIPTVPFHAQQQRNTGRTNQMLWHGGHQRKMGLCLMVFTWMGFVSDGWLHEAKRIKKKQEPWQKASCFWLPWVIRLALLLVVSLQMARHHLRWVPMTNLLPGSMGFGGMLL